MSCRYIEKYADLGAVQLFHWGLLLIRRQGLEDLAPLVKVLLEFLAQGRLREKKR